MNELTQQTSLSPVLERTVIPQSIPAEKKDARAILALFGNSLRCWWLIALIIGLTAATGAAAVVFYTFQPQYQASMWLQIYAHAPYIVFPGRDDSNQFIENQTQLIRSRLVLGALAKDPKIAAIEELETNGSIVDELAARLSVRPLGKSEFFAVDYRGGSVESSRYVVEQVIKAYIGLVNSADSMHREEVLELLTDEKLLREKKVEELRSTLAKLVEESIVHDGPTSAYSEEQMSNLAELRKRLVTIDVESAILKIEVEAMERFAGPPLVSNSTTSTINVDDHPRVVELERLIRESEEKLRVLDSAGMGDNHPLKKREQDGLVFRKKNLAETREKTLENLNESALNAMVSEREAVLSAMKSKLESYRITRQVLESHLADETKSVKKNSGDSLQVEFLRAELNQATAVQSLIARRMQEMKTEQRAPARVRPFEAEGVTIIPVEEMPYNRMAVVSIVALAAPFLLFFGLELVVHRVFNARQLESTGHLQVIGEIASLRKAGLSRYLQPRRWSTEKQLYRESVDHLRTFLVCQENDMHCQVIAINSAIGGEGKTSLAMQLSTSLAAASDKQVLLIDGDLRRPDTHNRLSTNLSPGLSDVLESRLTWQDAIRKPVTVGPCLLPAGELTSSPIRMLGNGNFEKLIDQLRPHFRYIIIDTPPVLSACESLVMSKVADMFLLCTRRDRSRMDLVRAAHERLLLAGAHCVGTVLTGVPFRNYSSRYGMYPFADTGSKPVRADWVNAGEVACANTCQD
jgi:capsular exopolysaccharide synthesis family protein